MANKLESNGYESQLAMKRILMKVTMKNVSPFVVFALSISAFNAHAWSLWEMSGAKMDVNGRDIRVASVSKVGNGHVFNSKDKELEKGVYVICVQDFTSTDYFPRTTALVRDYLRTRGLNVVDKIEDSAIAFKIKVRDLNIEKDAPRPAEPTNPPNSAAATVATQAVITKTVGVVAGVSYGMSSGHYEGTELEFASLSIVDPTPEKLGFNSETYAREQSGITARTAVKQSDPNTTTADLLTVMAKAWADRYFVTN